MLGSFKQKLLWMIAIILLLLLFIPCAVFFLREKQHKDWLHDVLHPTVMRSAQKSLDDYLQERIWDIQTLETSVDTRQSLHEQRQCLAFQMVALLNIYPYSRGFHIFLDTEKNEEITITRLYHPQDDWKYHLISSYLNDTKNMYVTQSRMSTQSDEKIENQISLQENQWASFQQYRSLLEAHLSDMGKKVLQDLKDQSSLGWTEPIVLKNGEKVFFLYCPVKNTQKVITGAILTCINFKIFSTVFENIMSPYKNFSFVLVDGQKNKIFTTEKHHVVDDAFMTALDETEIFDNVFKKKSFESFRHKEKIFYFLPLSEKTQSDWILIGYTTIKPFSIGFFAYMCAFTLLCFVLLWWSVRTFFSKFNPHYQGPVLHDSPLETVQEIYEYNKIKQYAAFYERCCMLYIPHYTSHKDFFSPEKQSQHNVIAKEEVLFFCVAVEWKQTLNEKEKMAHFGDIFFQISGFCTESGATIDMVQPYYFHITIPYRENTMHFLMELHGMATQSHAAYSITWSAGYVQTYGTYFVDNRCGFYVRFSEVINAVKRILRLAQFYHVACVVNQTFHDLLEKNVILRPIDVVYDSQTKESYAMYAFCGSYHSTDTLSLEHSYIALTTQEAFHAYQAKQWTTARKKYSIIAVKNDPLAEHMKKRCVWLLKHEVPASWNGVWDVHKHKPWIKDIK